jgi:hypothetical protein
MKSIDVNVLTRWILSIDICFTYREIEEGKQTRMKVGKGLIHRYICSKIDKQTKESKPKNEKIKDLNP